MILLYLVENPVDTRQVFSCHGTNVGQGHTVTGSVMLLVLVVVFYFSDIFKPD